jgi:Asp-tRNA(Asn)/Glu-tRNA(Gln) amidotransferase A subunit family amidase
MKGSEGLPVGIHVVSYPGHEEEVLDLMKQIEDEVKFGSKHKSKTFDLIE